MHHAVTPVPFVQSFAILAQAISEPISLTVKAPLTFVLVTVLDFSQLLKLSLSKFSELYRRIIEGCKLFVENL